MLAVQRPLPGVGELPQLALAADEARGVRALGGLKDLEERTNRDRLPLALQLEHSLLSDIDRAANEGERRDADQHLPRVRRLLQPRRHVHRVAGRQPLLGAGEHLARVDADPTLQAESRQGFPHLNRRPARPQRIILMHHRNTEHRHHRVPDELLHRATM